MIAAALARLADAVRSMLPRFRGAPQSGEHEDHACEHAADLFHRGLEEALAGQTACAVTFYSKAIALAPDPMFLLHRARIHRQCLRIADAVKDLETAFRLDKCGNDCLGRTIGEELRECRLLMTPCLDGTRERFLSDLRQRGAQGHDHAARRLGSVIFADNAQLAALHVLEELQLIESFADGPDVRAIKARRVQIFQRCSDIAGNMDVSARPYREKHFMFQSLLGVYEGCDLARIRTGILCHLIAQVASD